MAEPRHAVQGKRHLHTSTWFVLTFQVKNMGKDEKTASTMIFFFYLFKGPSLGTLPVPKEPY